MAPEGPTPYGSAARGAPPYGVAASVPSSISALDSVFMSEKIGTLGFISSNS
jgi:hypothetical protein